MSKFIVEHLKYPKAALQQRIEGTIHVKYDVNHVGKVTKVKLLTRLGYGCDEEAIRVVKLLKFKIPPNRGVRLTFHKEIHIHFKLPATKVIAPKPVSATNQRQINYIFTPKKTKQKPLPVQKKSTTITIVYPNN